MRLIQKICFTPVLLIAGFTIHQNAYAVDDCRIIDRLPAVIDEAGKYCLDRSHGTELEGNEAAIAIVSANVALDFRGHTITNQQGPTGICIDGYQEEPTVGVRVYEADNVRVHGGTVRCYSTGIEFTQSVCGDCNTANRVEHMLLESNYLFGIFMQGDHSVIQHNMVTETGGHRERDPRGIVALGHSNSIRNNDVMFVRDDGVGINVANGYNNLIVENRVQQVTTGFYFYGNQIRYRDNLTAAVSTAYSGLGIDLGNNH